MMWVFTTGTYRHRPPQMTTMIQNLLLLLLLVIRGCGKTKWEKIHNRYMYINFYYCPQVLDYR